MAASSIGRFEAGLRGITTRSFDRILAVLGERGIRFIEDHADEIAIGVLVLKSRLAQNFPSKEVTPRVGRRRRLPLPSSSPD